MKFNFSKKLKEENESLKTTLNGIIDNYKLLQKDYHELLLDKMKVQRTLSDVRIKNRNLTKENKKLKNEEQKLYEPTKTEELRKEATTTVQWECTPMIDRPTFINGYITGAEPREKRIAELEAQNEKLKCCSNCVYQGECDLSGYEECKNFDKWELRR